jgi:hypothetical protein
MLSVSYRVVRLQFQSLLLLSEVSEELIKSVSLFHLMNLTICV